MRIVVNGQQAFGKTVLDRLLERNENVIAVYGPADADAGRPDPLIEAAEAHGLPIHRPKSFKTPEAAETLRSLEPDLCVMAFVTRIVPSAFLDTPVHGTIQYHPSLLPRHRGPSSINWPIIAGETRTGLTIFWPDDGLDTGPVLLQKEVGIGPDDTLGSVYFDHLFPLGVDAVIEAVDMVRDGTAPKIAQDESRASYESWCRAEDVEIDWSRPVAEIYNLIRGADPQPGAWTKCGGATLQIFDAARIDGTDAGPGIIAAIDDDGITVGADGGGILIGRVRPEDGAKIAAAAFAAGQDIAVGTRLG